ncbi:MAG: DNA-directed RNA polymerase subunit N [Methanosarcinaceae archaeon]|nr:DNA-directed RNA polymerase subunit N [Methanosarcinaceae archaeon]
MIPVRCFSCGKVVAAGWEEFKKRTEAGEDKGAVLDDLGITRYCCRRMLLSHIEMIDVISPYQ